ncbi:hypothetical protein HY837_05265 [archaeon]|nr:hypothetical protein [archaeon]
MEKKLPEKALKTLEGLVEVKTEKKFEFLSVELMRLSYDSKVVKSDHYLLRDDPYSVQVGECTQATLSGKIPEGATHYSLGHLRSEEYVSRGKNMYGTFTDYVPIVFLKK